MSDITKKDIEMFEEEFNEMLGNRNNEWVKQTVNDFERKLREQFQDLIRYKIYKYEDFAEKMLYLLFNSEYIQNTFAKRDVYKKFFNCYKEEILNGIFNDVIKDIITGRKVEEIYSSLGSYWKKDIIDTFVKHSKKSDLLEYNELITENESLKKELQEIKDTLKGVVK